jgi:hypothetical protein
MKRRRGSYIARTNTKRPRINTIHTVHAVAQSPDAPYSELLDDLPLEIRVLIRSFLEPENRVVLQQTCWLLYLEDPGLIILPDILRWQKKMETLLTPLSVFAVTQITCNCEFLETYPGRTVYSDFKAHMLDDMCPVISLPGLTKGMAPLAACGLNDLNRLTDYILYTKYVTNGKVDREKIMERMMNRIIMFNENSEDDDETRVSKRTISKDKLDQEVLRVQGKYRYHRALVAYALKRRQERREWEEKMGVKVLES